MPIKYILLGIILLIVLRVTGKFRSKELGIREYVLWLLFWFGVAVVIFRPETASFVARVLGVGRGADVMVYLSVITLFYIVFRILVRQERMDKEITKIVREIALSKSETRNKN